MPDYTGFLGLYKPNRIDALALDTTLSDNFTAIDTKLGSGLTDERGTVYATLKERFKALDLITEDANGVSVKRFGAIGNGIISDSLAFQQALDIAKTQGSVTITVPAGKYRMTAELKIYKNTKIVFSPDAEMIRDHAGYMLMNGNRSTEPDPSNFTLYNGNGNITITGGIWNANGVVQTSKASIFHLGHAENITIEHAVLKDCSQSHHIEFNACRNLHVSHCIFLGWVGVGATFNEVIQLDLPMSAGSTIGSGDRTPCKDVFINNCYFGDSDTVGSSSIGRAFGSHSSVIGRAHQNINFTNNIVYNANSFVVRPYNWEKVVITGNLFVKCGAGVNWRTAMTGADTTDASGAQVGSEPMDFGIISDNIFAGDLSAGRTIEIYGESGTSGKPRQVVISGNVIEGDDKTNSGILVADSEYITVIGNRITGRMTGIEIRNTLIVVVTGNTISNVMSDAIRIEGSTHVNVSGNNIIRIELMGIRVVGGDNYVINGNIISGVNGAGTAGSTNRHISLGGGASKVSIVGNVCSNWGSTHVTTHALYATNTCNYISTAGNISYGLSWYNGGTGGTMDTYGNIT